MGTLESTPRCTTYGCPRALARCSKRFGRSSPKKWSPSPPSTSGWAVKAMVPIRVCQIIDEAIQIHGATGVSQWTPLADMYAARHPQLVRSLVVMGTSADIEESAEQMDQLIEVLSEHGMEPVLEGVLQFMMGDTTWGCDYR